MPLLTLVTSELWPETIEDYRRSGLAHWATLISSPKVGQGGSDDAETHNASLTRMRQQLIGELDVIVAVGGLLHRETPFNPGVQEELELAAEAGLYRIVVGGLGGKAAELAGDLESGDALTAIIDTADIGHCVHEVYSAILESRIGA